MINWRTLKVVIVIFMMFSGILVFYFSPVSAASLEMSNPYPPDGSSNIYPSGNITTSVDIAWENFTDTKPTNRTFENYTINDDFDMTILSLDYYAGQTITIGSGSDNVTQVLAGVWLMLKDSGQDIGDFIVEMRIYNDTAGKPEMTNISYGIFDENMLTTTQTWHYFPLPGALLGAGENYTIVLRRTETTGRLFWRSDLVGGTYLGGKAIQTSDGGESWGPFIDTNDMMFKVNSSTDWENILNLTFSSNSSGSWKQYGRKPIIRNETVSILNQNFTDFMTYYWNVSNYNDTGILLGTNTYSFSTVATLPPSVIINFAGNLSDSGGPYWRPPGESVALSGVWSDGYYTNSSWQTEDWMYINCTITDDYGVNKVFLHWYNQSGNNWDNTTALNNTGGNYWEVNTSGNLTVSAGYNYSFDIWANNTFDINGTYAWNKTTMSGKLIRRYIQLNCTPGSIDYRPFYFFYRDESYSDPQDDNKKDRLHHDQGTDGTIRDHGYLREKLNSGAVELLSCSSYIVLWFDESVCLDLFTLDNIYYHFWWTISDTEINVGWGETREEMSFLVQDSYETNTTNGNSHIYYGNDLGALWSNDYYLETSLLNVTDTTFTDNSIYETYVRILKVMKYPSIISNNSFPSFVILNVPDNATLNATHGDTDSDGLTDWGELYLYYTSPFLNDTDNDGTTDLWEITYGSDPNDYTNAAYIPLPPNNLAITVQANLTWINGENADRTVIIRKQDSYPTNRLDGTLIFNSTEDYFNDTGATIGNHYYYRAWSFNETYGLFSDNYADVDTIIGIPALFDIRDINIIDNVLNTLHIYVTVENVGDLAEDMVLYWNLTTDSGAILDAGSDTFAVGGHTQVLYDIEPYTTYVGYITITFEGNGASASERFETVLVSKSAPFIKQKSYLEVVVMGGDIPILHAEVSVYRSNLLIDEQLTGYDGKAKFSLDAGIYIVKVSYGSYFEEKSIQMVSPRDEVLLFTIEEKAKIDYIWMWFFLIIFIVGIAIYIYYKKTKKHQRKKSVGH